MRQMIEKYGSLLVVKGVGFLRFLLQQNGWGLERGIILVADDNFHARQVEKSLLDSEDAVQIGKSISKCNKPYNYEIGVHLYKKYERNEELVDFLSQRDFLPVIITGGVVPDVLWGEAYTFRLRATGEEVDEFKSVYSKMKTFVLENLEHVLFELRRLPKNKILNQDEVPECYLQLLQVLVAVGNVWEMVFEEASDKMDSGLWIEEFYRFSSMEIQHMDDFDGVYDVGQAVKSCVFSYIQNSLEISIASVGDAIGLGAQVILEDAEFYYFAESLLKQICKPLNRTISFLQLKREMHESGFLVCNELSTNNFTVKVSVCDKKTGTNIRQRLLKLRKNFLVRDDGLMLGDMIMLNTM